MKKIIFISSLLLFTALPIWIVWDKEQKGVEMMTGGFGTQYADAPHPFNRPDYPVRCQGVLGNDREDVILTIHQGETVLRIPRDAIREVKKRSDSETCIPISIKLEYQWYDSKLLRGVRDDNEARDAGFGSVEDQYTRVIVTLNGLQDMDHSTPQMNQKNKYAEAKRYTPAYRHEFLPIWYYPNLYYDRYPVSTHGFGVANTVDPQTNHPYRVRCSLNVDPIESKENRYGYDPEKFINAEMTPMSDWGGSKCEGGKRIRVFDKEIPAGLEIDVKVVPYMDKIYNSIDAVIQNYATPSSTTDLNQ